MNRRSPDDLHSASPIHALPQASAMSVGSRAKMHSFKPIDPVCEEGVSMIARMIPALSTSSDSGDPRVGSGFVVRRHRRIHRTWKHPSRVLSV